MPTIVPATFAVPISYISPDGNSQLYGQTVAYRVNDAAAVPINWPPVPENWIPVYELGASNFVLEDGSPINPVAFAERLRAKVEAA